MRVCGGGGADLSIECCELYFCECVPTNFFLCFASCACVIPGKIDYTRLFDGGGGTGTHACGSSERGASGVGRGVAHSSITDVDCAVVFFFLEEHIVFLFTSKFLEII